MSNEAQHWRAASWVNPPVFDWGRNVLESGTAYFNYAASSDPMKPTPQAVQLYSPDTILGMEASLTLTDDRWRLSNDSNSARYTILVLITSVPVLRQWKHRPVLVRVALSLKPVEEMSRPRTRAYMPVRRGFEL